MVGRASELSEKPSTILKNPPSFCKEGLLQKTKKRNKKETIDKWDTPTYFWEPLTKWCREKGNGLDKRF